MRFVSPATGTVLDLVVRKCKWWKPRWKKTRTGSMSLPQCLAVRDALLGLDYAKRPP